MRRAIRPLLWTWLGLLALLALTAGSALLRLGAWNGVVNLAIALTKALLVLIVFMRLGAAHALVRLAALAGVITLGLLFLLSGSDYLTRAMVPAPLQTPQQVAPHWAAHS